MARDPIAVRGVPSDPLSEQMSAARIGPPPGGISAGAHPEFSRPTTLDNVVSAAKNYWARMHAPKNHPAPPITNSDPVGAQQQVDAMRAKADTYLRK